MRGQAAAVLLLLSSLAPAHDLITGESAERYLADARRYRDVMSSGAPAPQRADASYRLGVMLDEIREFLNRDLAAHGEVQGLPSNYLVSQLERLGVPLAFSGELKRYLSNARHYERALRLAPAGPAAADTGFRLLAGKFYDSFESDPLAGNESWHALEEQIALAERLQGQELSREQREEVEFILAVSYVRANIRAPSSSLASRYGARARSAMDAFERRYPDSLRTAAMPVLAERLRR